MIYYMGYPKPQLPKYRIKNEAATETKLCGNLLYFNSIILIYFNLIGVKNIAKSAIRHKGPQRKRGINSIFIFTESLNIILITLELSVTRL